MSQDSHWAAHTAARVGGSPPRRLHTSRSAHTVGAVLPVYRQNDLFIVWHLLCLGDLCTPTSDAPGDRRCNIKSSRRAVRTSNSPPISWPRPTGANFSAFAVGTVIQDQVSCALSPVVQSLRPSPVLPFVLEPTRVTRCQSSCANGADQPAMLPKLDVSACIQPLGPSSAARITPQTMRFTILGGGGAKLAALCLITALCNRIFPCSSPSAVTATKSLISSSVCWFCGAL